MRRRTLTDREARGLDLVLVLLAAVMGVGRELLFPGTERRLLQPALWICVLVQLAGAMTLWWRRSHPARVAFVNVVLNLVSPTQASPIAAYSLGAHLGLGWRSVLAFVAVLASWMLGAQLWKLEDMFTGPVVLVALFVIGLYVTARRALVDALADRAERAEREQALLAARAVADERTRIAREMHDLIANRVSMMVLQAGAIGVSAPDPAVRSASDQLRQTGIRTLDELRGLVSALREPGEEEPGSATAHAQTTVIDIVAAARRAGLDVDLEVNGAPRAMSDPSARAVDRIVQEGLTNAAKHSPGAAVEIIVSHDEDQSLVRVRNEPAAAGDDRGLGSTGAGAGLTGLRERVRLLGGTLESGAEPDGGYLLSASVPHHTISGPPSPRGRIGVHARRGDDA
ncbi:sensor histidine kinase [Blastococcus sp. Marseille-P5729]|uniref:sensor histidine kinase n=1 Tax=Blastococcus sp. Marseille-P5729 TaxID=2086582 RepID=UPI000D10821F|nr:histidine kinase [Blastococcus sp. Marseille-P5729]